MSIHVSACICIDKRVNTVILWKSCTPMHFHKHIIKTKIYGKSINTFNVNIFQSNILFYSIYRLNYIEVTKHFNMFVSL